jgi:hypothetical protein
MNAYATFECVYESFGMKYDDMVQEFRYYQSIEQIFNESLADLQWMEKELVNSEIKISDK